VLKKTPSTATDLYLFPDHFLKKKSPSNIYWQTKVRLLLDPFLLALKRRFTDSNEEKMLRLIDFLSLFNYQLSGEVVMQRDLMVRMRVALDWGIEIFTLIEVYRKANQNQVAQVDFSREPFEHKHQVVSGGGGGLEKMALDIIHTLLNALIIEEGLEVSEHFFRDVAVTYEAIALDLVKKYSDTARFNEIHYDRHAEEELVKTIFKKVILKASEHFLSPRKQADQFLRFTAANPEFKPFNEKGLAAVILDVAEKNRLRTAMHPETPSWERVQEKHPDIMMRLVDAIETEKSKWGGGQMENSKDDRR